MEQTIEADDQGTLHLPAALLPEGGPNTVYRVKVLSGELVVSPAGKSVAVVTVDRTEWVQTFQKWTESHTNGPGLADSAVGRDSIYE